MTALTKFQNDHEAIGYGALTVLGLKQLRDAFAAHPEDPRNAEVVSFLEKQIERVTATCERDMDEVCGLRPEDRATIYAAAAEAFPAWNKLLGAISHATEQRARADGLPATDQARRRIYGKQRWR